MADESLAVAERGSKGEEVAGLREDDAKPGAPPPPQAPPSPPAGSPELLALGNFLAKQGAIGQKARAQADAIRPKIEAVAQQGNDLAAQAQATTPQAPALPPPPSRQLHGFLAPHEGESPEASVGKFITAIGVFAGGAAGLMKGNARGSLAALTGALKGWQEGDAEKADREYADWKSKTDTLLKDFDNRSASWERWFKASKLSLDQRVKGLELEMRADGMDLDAAKLEAAPAQYLFEKMDEWHKHRELIEIRKSEIERQREAAQNTQAYHAETLAETKRHHMAVEAAGKQQAEAALAEIGPDGLTALGMQWARGELPARITQGKLGPVLMPKIVAAGMKWAKDNNIDPTSLSGMQADLVAAKKALVKLKTNDVTTEAQAARFDTHMDALVLLSEALDKSNRPVFERWRQKMAGNYGGDADVARIEVQALEVAMEYVKLTVGSAQGDAATREEGRRIINSWMSKPQMRAVAEQLKQNAHNNVANNRAKEQELTRFIDSAGGRIDRTGVAQPPAPDKPTMPDTRKRITITDGKEWGSVYADSDWQAKYPGWKESK